MLGKDNIMYIRYNVRVHKETVVYFMTQCVIM